MTSPVPGWTPLSALSWGSNQHITAGRLRADLGSLSQLYTAARPMLVLTDNNGDTITGNVLTNLVSNAFTLNNWGASLSGANQSIPLTGFYLVQGITLFTESGTASGNSFFVSGIGVQQNGGLTNSIDGGCVSGDNVNGDTCGASVLDIYLMNQPTNDYFRLYGFTPGVTVTASTCQLMAEWVALPNVSQSGYTGPLGTVVTNPHASALPGSDPGTTLTSSPVAGATSFTVADSTGIVAGATIGIDWQQGQEQQNIAEQVIVSTLAGNTIVTTTGLLYGHSSGAPVAVPLSAAYLNQQSRDLVNFLFYPPIYRSHQSAAQAIGSTTFPTSVQVTSMTVDIDTFSGAGSNQYTIQVSGVYLVYLQVWMNGSTTAADYACGISITGSITATYWGTRQHCAPSVSQLQAPTFRRMIRFHAGDVITFQAAQNSGGSMNTSINTPRTNSRAVILWRAF